MIDGTGDSMRAGNRAVLLQAGTGSGKTVIASSLVQRAQAKNSGTWFVVPRRELLLQTMKTYQKFGISSGFVAAGYKDTYSKNKICSMETLVRRLDTLKPPKLAIIDETHVGAVSLDTLVAWLLSHGSYIIGLSATPWKLSGKGLGCWYDDMVCGESIRWLIDNKRLSEYRAFAPSAPDLSSIKTSGGDYAKGELDNYMRNDGVLVGDAVSHYKKHAMGRLNIAYGVSIAHSQMIADSFNSAGIPAAHLDGKTPDDEKRRIIKAYANRELLVLSNCELLTYGFDLAAQVNKDVTVESMSDLRPTKSLALQMQKWGRVLRMKDDPAIIFDHANNIMEHDLPCSDRLWTLEGRKKKKGHGVEPTIPVKQCSNCFRCHQPAPVCPSCGHVYPIISRKMEEEEGELEAVDPEKLAAMKAIKKQEVGRARTMNELRRIAKERGYKPAWVFQMAKAKRITK